MTIRKSLLSTFAFLLLSSPVLADAQFEVSFFLEPDLTPAATQTVCFLTTGTPRPGITQGTWYSSSFPNWKGDWYRELDFMRWYGRTGIGLATDENHGFLARSDSAATIFAGEFEHFIATGSSVPPLTSTRGHWTLTYQGQKCGLPSSGPAPSGDPAK
jgi:hypothetical protein